MNQKIGNVQYMAPEMINIKSKKSKYGYGFQVDIWAAGVILYGLMYGNLPF